MQTRFGTRLATAAIIALTAAVGGCDGGASPLNPAFINSLYGDYFPVTPGPNVAFVFVRVVNETEDIVEFIVTIDRNVLVTDEEGNLQLDDRGDFVTRSERETVRLTTFPEGNAGELGVLFDCGKSQITRVGLGDNLLPTDAAAFVGGAGVGGATGFGIPVGNLNPLLLSEGNFNCGDTIIYRAVLSTGVTGGVSLQSFLLPGSEQPTSFRGPSTFANLERFLESQVREDEP